MSHVSDLASLGALHSTDKVPHSYMGHYEERFKVLRELPVVILELGILKGSSLRVWRDYFPQGQVYGIDGDQESVDSVAGEERIEGFLGQQDDVTFLAAVVEKTGQFDIVIDDCSHRAPDQVVSFEFLWPYVKPGGWYVIEDCSLLFFPPWTQLEEGTILDLLQERWKSIIVAEDEIGQVHIVGSGGKGQHRDGLIFIRKRNT